MKQFITAFLLAVYGTAQAQMGYRYMNEFIPLKEKNSSLYYVQLKNNDVLGEKELKSFENQKQHIIARFSDKSGVIKKNNDINKEIFYLSPIYETPQGASVIVLPRLIVKFSDGKTVKNVMEFGRGRISLKEQKNGIYKFDCSVECAENILSLAEDISKLDGVEWCEPAKVSNWKLANPYYSQQYYLKNLYGGIDINIEDAWGLVDGLNGITVAVIDTGVESNHEDISNCLSGYTVGNSSGYGAPQQINDVTSKGHGTCCAGVIAADNNSLGIRGVASGVNILPVNIFPGWGYEIDGQKYEGVASDDEIADAIRWAYQRADVLSCSWGGGAYSQNMAIAITEARTQGRNGKGCVVVFSAGNGYQNGYLTPSFPANVSGVITVGSVDEFGTVSAFSQRGGSLDLVAPGEGIITTDRMGSLGYSAGDYVTVSGTSFSCPQVSGAAALMLSMNPLLTESDVKSILNNSCTKIPGYTYNSSGWSDQVGNGLLNVYEAVSKCKWEINGSSHLCSSSTSYYSVDNLAPSCTVTWELLYHPSPTPPSGAIPQPEEDDFFEVNVTANTYFNDIVQAIIWRNDAPIDTLRKKISTGANFQAVYYLGNDSTNTYILHDGGTIDADGFVPVTLQSDDFIGIQLNCSDSRLSVSTIDSEQGIIRIKYPFMLPLPGTLIKATLSGNNTTNCSNFKFYYRGIAEMSHDPLLSMQNNGNELYINVNQSIVSRDATWQLVISDVLNGTVILDKEKSDSTEIINMKNWPKGLYSVTIVYGKQKETVKINVR